MLRWKKTRPKREAGETSHLEREDDWFPTNEVREPEEVANLDEPEDGIAGVVAAETPGPSLAEAMKNPPEIVFRRAGADWEARVERDGFHVQVLVEDVDGQPNSEFAPKVAGILADLPNLDFKARASEPDLAVRLTPDHHLSLVSETHPKADFALGFEARGETVIVDFKDGDVFSWCFLAEEAEELSLAR